MSSFLKHFKRHFKSSSSATTPVLQDQQQENEKVNENSGGQISSECRSFTSPLPRAVSVSSNGSAVSKSDRGRKGTSTTLMTWSPLDFGTSMTSDLYAIQFPGALPFESTVFAWHFAQNVWHSATIILARVSSGSDYAQVPSRKAETYGLNIPNFVPYSWSIDVMAYDYYIHFHGDDRRHDVWVQASLLRPVNYSFKTSEQHKSVEPGPDDIHKQMDVEYLREHEENTKLKTIGSVSIGNYLVDTWYFSPYPKEFQNLPILYICQFCLSFFKRSSERACHCLVCPFYGPPGDEIYRDTEKGVTVFEVDGSEAKTYAENLCFLSKLFLDHKTLRHPVHLFLFYVLGEIHDDGIHVVGYFSKEKYSKNNLSCIMCLPQYQRKGYGQFLVNISYALSWREGKRGTPERPLSDLGRAAYVKYWSQVSLYVLLSLATNQGDDCEISIEDLASITSVEAADLALALKTIGVLTCSQGLTFFFLPSEYDGLEHLWSREPFLSTPVTGEATEQLRYLLSEHSSLQASEKTNFSSTKSSTTSSIVIAKKNRKRRKDQAETRDLLATKRTKSIEKKMLGPVNLAWLRWESYDLHLAPYEYAPTVL